MPTGVKKSFLSVLFLLALASLVVGATLDEEIKHYLNSGETYTATNVTVDGAAYALVKVGNVESFVFNSSFEPVREDAVVAQVVDAYVQVQYEQMAPINTASIRSAYESINTSIRGTCLGDKLNGGVEYFVTNTGALNYILIRFQCSLRPKQCVALDHINLTVNDVRSSMKVVDDSLTGLEAAVATKKPTDVYDNLGRVNRAATALQANYSLLSSDYTTIAYGTGGESGFVYAFGTTYNCNVSSALSSSFTNLISLTSASNPFDVPTMLSRIKSATDLRYGPAQVRKVYDEEMVRLLESKALRDKVSSNFSSLGLVLSFLPGKYVQLESKFAAIANATNVATAQQLATAFQAERGTFDTLLTLYQTLLFDYNASKAALSSATSKIALAATKYGSTDSRVQDLRKEQLNLTTRLTLLENDLKTGKTLTSQQFKDVAGSGEALALRAAELKPMEAQLDFLLIGGVILVVAIVAGVIWYARKRKTEYGLSQ